MAIALKTTSRTVRVQIGYINSSERSPPVSNTFGKRYRRYRARKDDCACLKTSTRRFEVMGREGESA